MIVKESPIKIVLINSGFHEIQNFFCSQIHWLPRVPPYCAKPDRIANRFSLDAQRIVFIIIAE